jgi:hypothetical protein
MTFSKYRDQALEQALHDYSKRGRARLSPIETKCILTNNCWTDTHLSTINDFVHRAIGRNIEADDFCRLSKDGLSALTFNTIHAIYREIFSHVIKHGQTFSADALLQPNEVRGDRDTPIDRLSKEGFLEALFDPDLWKRDPDSLYDLRDRTSGSVRSLADACIAKLGPAASFTITPTFDRAAALGKSGRRSPFARLENWGKFEEVQAQLSRRGEALTLSDMVETVLADGTPLLVQAAKAGKLETAVLPVLANSDGRITVNDLNRSVGASQTMLEALAETGQLMPVLQALGLNPTEMVQATKKLTFAQQAENGLDAIALRQQLRGGSCQSSPMRGLRRWLGL